MILKKSKNIEAKIEIIRATYLPLDMCDYDSFFIIQPYMGLKKKELTEFAAQNMLANRRKCEIHAIRYVTELIEEPKEYEEDQVLSDYFCNKRAAYNQPVIVNPDPLTDDKKWIIVGLDA